MEPTDITIEILKDIRDGVRSTNARIDSTNARLDTTNARLEQMRTDLSERIDRLEHRQVASEMHLATELIAVAGAVSGLRDDLREDRALRRRVDDHERRIQGLESRAE